MKELLDKLLQRHKYLEPTAEEELRRQVNVLYGAFTGLIGSEKMVLRASKYSALSYIHSEDPRQRLVGLQRLIYEDVSYDKVPDDDEVINVLNELEMVLAEMLARQAVEERLEKKILALMDKVQAAVPDEDRLLQEVAIYSDKVDFTEEVVRFRSHLNQLHAMLQSPGEVGRKLDFLIQEMNRETNTIGSKAGDLAVTEAVLQLKNEIEKIREQVQNIE